MFSQSGWESLSSELIYSQVENSPAMSPHALKSRDFFLYFFFMKVTECSIGPLPNGVSNVCDRKGGIFD